MSQLLQKELVVKNVFPNVTFDVPLWGCYVCVCYAQHIHCGMHDSVYMYAQKTFCYSWKHTSITLCSRPFLHIPNNEVLFVLFFFFYITVR